MAWQFREWTKNAVPADQVKPADKVDDPDKLGDWPGEDNQKRKEDSNSVIAFGARIGSISGVRGGVINLQA
jgi:hypothetical protein